MQQLSPAALPPLSGAALTAELAHTAHLPTVEDPATALAALDPAASAAPATEPPPLVATAALTLVDLPPELLEVLVKLVATLPEPPLSAWAPSAVAADTLATEAPSLATSPRSALMAASVLTVVSVVLVAMAELMPPLSLAVPITLPIVATTAFAMST